ncbi:MAG: phytanoyl-CoA dioxygenase family protein [Aquisalimonadaceae bacterium]
MNPQSTRAPAPKPTLEAALRDVDEHGVGIVDRALSTAQTDDIRERLWRAAGMADEHGIRTRGAVPADADTNNIRILELFNWDLAFVDLAMNETALTAVRHVLGERFLISNYTANITGPGSGSMRLHADQGYVMPPWPDKPLAVNTLWMIDDFHEEVGATRYVPGTHLSRESPDPDQTYPTVSIEGAAGSLIIMDGRVWHTSGENRTQNQYRSGILGYYVLPWLRAQRNWNAALRKDVVDSMDPEFLKLLGYTEGNTELFRRGWQK